MLGHWHAGREWRYPEATPKVEPIHVGSSLLTARNTRGTHVPRSDPLHLCQTHMRAHLLRGEGRVSSRLPVARTAHRYVPKLRCSQDHTCSMARSACPSRPCSANKTGLGPQDRPTSQVNPAPAVLVPHVHSSEQTCREFRGEASGAHHRRSSGRRPSEGAPAMAIRRTFRRGFPCGYVVVIFLVDQVRPSRLTV